MLLLLWTNHLLGKPHDSEESVLLDLVGRDRLRSIDDLVALLRDGAGDDAPVPVLPADTDLENLVLEIRKV